MLNSRLSICAMTAMNWFGQRRREVFEAISQSLMAIALVRCDMLVANFDSVIEISMPTTWPPAILATTAGYICTVKCRLSIALEYSKLVREVHMGCCTSSTVKELLNVGLVESKEQDVHAQVNSCRQRRISIVYTLYISQQPHVTQAKGMTALHQCAT
jgi:hypothetical protein